MKSAPLLLSAHGLLVLVLAGALALRDTGSLAVAMGILISVVLVETAAVAMVVQRWLGAFADRAAWQVWILTAQGVVFVAFPADVALDVHGGLRVVLTTVAVLAAAWWVSKLVGLGRALRTASNVGPPPRHTASGEARDARESAPQTP